MKERPILFNSEMVRAILENRKSQTRRVVKPQPFPSTMHDDNRLLYIPKWMKTGWAEIPKDIREDRVCPYGKPGDRLWVRETWRVGAWREPTSTAPLGMMDRGDVVYPAGFALDFKASPEEISTPWLHAGESAKKLIQQSRHDCENAIKRDPERWFRDGPDFGWARGDSPCRWRPSIHMPRWASRITLEVTDVRVERVQDISWEDSISEGIKRLSSMGPLRAKGWKDYGDGPGFMVPTTSFRTLWDSINAKRGFGWDTNPWVWVVEFKTTPSAVDSCSLA